MELKSVEDTSWLQLFIKNTALCKHESGRVRCDACPLFCATPACLRKQKSRLSRSYACNLPSSFSIVLSSALVCSTCPPVSV